MNTSTTTTTTTGIKLSFQNMSLSYAQTQQAAGGKLSDGGTLQLTMHIQQGIVAAAQRGHLANTIEICMEIALRPRDFITQSGKFANDPRAAGQNAWTAAAVAFAIGYKDTHTQEEYKLITVPKIAKAERAVGERSPVLAIVNMRASVTFGIMCLFNCTKIPKSIVWRRKWGSSPTAWNADQIYDYLKATTEMNEEQLEKSSLIQYGQFQLCISVLEDTHSLKGMWVGLWGILDQCYSDWRLNIVSNTYTFNT